jgi:hypothetical protein
MALKPLDSVSCMLYRVFMENFKPYSQADPGTMDVRPDGSVRWKGKGRAPLPVAIFRDGILFFRTRLRGTFLECHVKMPD